MESGLSVIVFPVCIALTEEDLRDVFSEYGEIIDVFIPDHKDAVDLRTYALIKFRKVYEALKAIESMDGSKIYLERIWVQKMSKDNIRKLQKQIGIWIHDIDLLKCDYDGLYQQFSKYGPIIGKPEINLYKDFEDQPKGYAYIRYATFPSCRRAATAMKNVMFLDSRVKIKICAISQMIKRSHASKIREFLN